MPGRAEVFVHDVVRPYAEAYAQIREARYESASGAEAVNAWFRRLQQVDNYDWRPAALWALRHNEDDPAWLDTFMRALERLSASMFVRRVYTTLASHATPSCFGNSTKDKASTPLPSN